MIPPLNAILRAFRRKPRGTGARGEALAAKFLRRQRYRIAARNLRNRFGEIDLLAFAPDGRTLVLVEVKTADAASDPNRRPEFRVDLAKRRRLTALAAQIARRYRFTDRPIRFDVIGVDLPPNAKPVIRHFPAAFEATM